MRTTTRISTRRAFGVVAAATLAVAGVFAGTATASEEDPPKVAPAPLTEPPPGLIPYDDLPPAGLGADFVSVRPWDHENLTYFFQNGTADIAGDAERPAVRAAFSLWSDASDLTFQEVGSAAAADIVILWGTGEHGDGDAFDGPFGVLAHAYFPPPNSGALAGDAHFDDGETWTTSTRPPDGQPIDLTTVAAHEIGHSIGLDHSANPDALMFAFYDGSHRFLHGDDIFGVNLIYGSGAPANDRFTDARVLAGSSGTAAGTNVGATREAGEPLHAGELGGRSVWYRWTAPASGPVTFRTAGSTFDTILATYTGNAVNGLAPVPSGSNDDVDGGVQSRVTFSATAGTTYRIAVDGFDAEVGAVKLAWQAAGTSPPTVSPTAVAAAPTGVAGQARVSYTPIPASANGGAAVTKYRATCRTFLHPERAAEDTSGPFGPITVGGMVVGVTYSCSVRAFNANGAGPESVGVLVGSPGAPPAVANVKGALTGSIRVNWTTAPTPPGSPLTGHGVVCSAPGSTKGTLTGGAARTATIGGLVRTKTYTCKVAAANKWGGGPLRNAASGTKPT